MNKRNILEIGSLEWARATGGALTDREKVLFVLDGIPDLLAASLKRIFSKHAAKMDLARLAPPGTAIVNEAIRILKNTTVAPMVNHSFRTAYWTLVVMQRENPGLTREEIEEAWLAALIHDVGLGRPPEFGEFTLGGAAVISELSERFGWDKDSEHKASEAITLNPNAHVKKEKFGLLAWAMNVGGYGETSLGPYRILMHPENIRELETMYPRTGLYQAMPQLVDKELCRFPNQRFAVLKALGFVQRRLKD